MPIYRRRVEAKLNDLQDKIAQAVTEGGGNMNPMSAALIIGLPFMIREDLREISIIDSWIYNKIHPLEEGGEVDLFAEAPEDLKVLEKELSIVTTTWMVVNSPFFVVGTVGIIIVAFLAFSSVYGVFANLSRLMMTGLAERAQKETLATA